MNTGPAAVAALPAPLPNSPSELDLTPLLDADGLTTVVVVFIALVVGVVVAAAHAAAAWSPTGSR